ncbi:MAG: hypothetical protein NVSMB55_27340 [Mycobacteriales bacterium]
MQICTDGICLPKEAQTHYGTPREVAGGAVTIDNLTCQLRPLVDRGFGQAGLSAAQFQRPRKVVRTGSPSGRRSGLMGRAG